MAGKERKVDWQEDIKDIARIFTITIFVSYLWNGILSIDNWSCIVNKDKKIYKGQLIVDFVVKDG